MRTILVTGADGFIGQNLIRAFSAFDFEVKAINKKYGDIITKSI
jgi:nucleoside-diphosphate-sugar epimerase